MVAAEEGIDAIQLLRGAKLLFQGAESKAYIGEFLGQRVLLKERFRKRYRHQDLDAELRKLRTRSECRNIIKARNCGVSVPYILAVRPEHGLICMEYIAGLSVADYLNGTGNVSEPSLPEASKPEASKPEEACKRQVSLEQVRAIGRCAGKTICKLHDAGIIHGDLTTSNMMLRTTTADCLELDQLELVLIDLGLSHCSTSSEDRAVDLHVFTRAIRSNHCSIADQLIAGVLDGYEESSKEGAKTCQQLQVVEKRGRKRL
ncbi:protein kinase domain protein [Gregarina niphandrodes]|uniref:non-specific serine/threonine protein kinase n=1 Tax=Gregarina niphandrodes TaxID=110365 RepID=A0A023B5L7_GRENI|nr:protein kinase domain protein [Gregarina niphandrodes]EZG61133.1 protein kinase domain protein [Gregarina niphandrodes]|eukprot:XP_011130786.1 protein kinase domain protein [Gregarina niphandrodes]